MNKHGWVDAQAQEASRTPEQYTFCLRHQDRTHYTAVTQSLPYETFRKEIDARTHAVLPLSAPSARSIPPTLDSTSPPLIRFYIERRN